MTKKYSKGFTLIRTSLRENLAPSVRTSLRENLAPSVRTSLRENLENSKQGFTLIEVLIVAVITTIMGGALLGLQYLLSTNQVVVWQNLISVEEANANLTQMVKEVRTARDGDNGAYPLVLAGDQELIFYSDYDFDDVIERIRYFVSGDTLQKGVIEPSGFPVTYNTNNEIIKTVSENVRSGTDPVFYYYNGEWPSDEINNPLVQAGRLADTRLIRVSLRLNTQVNQPDKDYVLESYTQLRQLKE